MLVAPAHPASMAYHSTADGMQSPSPLSLQGIVRGYSAASISSAVALPLSSFGAASPHAAGVQQFGLPIMQQARAQSMQTPSNLSISLPWSPQGGGPLSSPSQPQPQALSQMQLQQLLLQHQAQQQRAMQAQAQILENQQSPSRQLPSPAAAQIVPAASASSAGSPVEPPASVPPSVASISPSLPIARVDAASSNTSAMEDAPQQAASVAAVSSGAAPSALANPVTAVSAAAPAAASAAVPASSSSSSSSLLQSPFDSELWLLMLHQLYHSPAAWARDMAQTIFLQLQHEAQKANEETQRRQLQLAASSCSTPLMRQRNIVAAAASDPSSLLSACDWTGAPRPLSLDELMSRQASAAFPRDYTAQLLRELMASKARDAAAASVAHDPLLAEHALASSAHASPSKRKPLLPGVGHSLLGSTAAPAGSIWATGGRALLPSLRRRGPDMRGSINVISHLLHRSRGSPRVRSLAPSAAPVTSSASALTNTLYCRALRKLKMVTGHTSPIYCVVLDRTGQRAFTGSDDHTVKIWDVSSGRLLATCRGHENVITEIVVSPDNTIVASSSLDKRIRLWDINGVALGVLVGHTADVMRVVFNPDWSCAPMAPSSSAAAASASASSGRRLLISASLDGTARIWDCANLGGQPIVVSSRPKPWPRDEHNAYVPYDPELLAARGNEDEPALIVAPPSNPEFNCIAFHPEGREFVCGHSDLRARVYNVSRGCLFAILSGHKAEVEHVCYSADGQRILTVAADGEAIVWSRIEFSQMLDSCKMVHAEMPVAPPSANPNAWDATAAPLPGANFYRALRAPPVANYPQQASAAAPIPTVAAASIDPVAATAAAHLPTHRYILSARLIVAPSSDEPVASAASAAGAAGAAAPKIQLASWSLHDDFIVGCTDKHAVLVWRIPPLLMDAEGRPKLERQDPYMAQQIQWAEQSKHATTRSATGAISSLPSWVEKPAPSPPERATGRSKRLGSVAAPAAASASSAPSASLSRAPLNFLSCFRRQTLTPHFTFNVHTESIGVLHRHPLHPDLIVSAGADGRVVWYDAARGRVLRVFRETVPTNAPVPAGLSASAARRLSRMPSAFIDGNFSPASSTGSGGGGGSMLLLTTESGQIYFMGSGVGNGSAYLLAPEQQFFVRDYLELQRDAQDNVIDLDSQTLPHLAPGATTLQDAAGNVYPHQLPPAPPLVRRAIGVSQPLPIRAPPRARIKLFAAGREPKYSCTSVQSMRTGLSLSEAASSAQPTDDPIEVDSDCWRTSVGPTSKLSHPIPSDLTPAHFASLWRAQLTRDSEALKFLYQLRVAWQQQRGIVRVANRFHAQERARLRDADSDAEDRSEPAGLVIPPTWHPSMTFPLPASTPLLDAAEEAQVHDEDEMEGAEETKLFRRCEFDAQGMTRRHRLLVGERRGPAAVQPPPISPERPTRNRARAAAATAPAAAAAAAADTRGSTRRRPISLDDFDDDYRDDDFDPAAREDAAGEEEPHEDEAALPAGAGRSQRRNARAQGRALRRFEEMKEEQPQARPSRSTRQTAAAAAAAEEDDEEDEEEEEKKAAAADAADSSRDHSEYSEAEEPIQRTRAGRSRVIHDDSESSASDEASDSDLLDSPSPSNSDSDASYGAHRAEGDTGRSSRNKRKRKSNNRASRRSNRQRRDDDNAPHVGRSTRNSGAAAAAASGHDHSTRRSSKRSRAEQDWSEGEYDEDEEMKLQNSDRAARARKRRDAAKHTRSNQHTHQEDDGQAFAEEEDAPDTEESKSEMSRLLRPGNWLERPLTQQYNAVYTPQLGDEVVYCRVGHESALKKDVDRAYPRTHLPNPSLPPFVACLVARVQYMWHEDAHQAAPRNRYHRLAGAGGRVDPATLNLPPPFAFARITLVPMADAYLIRNPAHPIPADRGASPEQPADAAMQIEELSAKKEEQGVKTEMVDDSAAAAAASSTAAAAAAPVPERTYDFSTLAPPTRWFECTKSTPDLLVLKRVVRPGDDWIPISEKVARKRRLEDEQMALAAAQAAAEEEERARRKRSLRGSEPEPQHAEHAVGQRQSLRSVILQSKLEAAAPAASQPAASSSQRTRAAPRRVADDGDDEYEPLPYPEDEDDPDRALALKLAQQPARSSARHRQPKKPDPYEAQLLSQAPQYAPTRPRSTGGSKAEVSLRSPNADGSSLEFPASSFIVDLFEPQGADYIVLASRMRACGSMAPWISRSADADSNWSSSPSPAAGAPAASSSSSAAAAASSVRQWERGDRFRMKFVDESTWSEGVVLSNALHDEAMAAANAVAAAAAARVTRNALKQGPVAPSPPPGPTATPWECVRVAWKTEAELQQMLAEQAADRASSLVATENLSHLSPEAAAAHRRLQLLASLPPEDWVSPWEIDPVDRPVTEIEDIDCLIASMASRAEGPSSAPAAATSASASAAASTSSSFSPSRVCRPELVHLSDPDVVLDLGESVDPKLTGVLLGLIDQFLSNAQFAAFAKPVRGIKLYRHVVPYASDLATMRSRLELRYYRSVSALASDVRALFDAAYLFNEPDSLIVLGARKLEVRMMRAIYRASRPTGDFARIIQPANLVAWELTEEEEAKEQQQEQEASQGASTEREEGEVVDAAAAASSAAARLAASVASLVAPNASATAARLPSARSGPARPPRRLATTGARLSSVAQPTATARATRQQQQQPTTASAASAAAAAASSSSSVPRSEGSLDERKESVDAESSTTNAVALTEAPAAATTPTPMDLDDAPTAAASAPVTAQPPPTQSSPVAAIPASSPSVAASNSLSAMHAAIMAAAAAAGAAGEQVASDVKIEHQASPEHKSNPIS